MIEKGNPALRDGAPEKFANGTNHCKRDITRHFCRMQAHPAALNRRYGSRYKLLVALLGEGSLHA